MGIGAIVGFGTGRARQAAAADADAEIPPALAQAAVKLGYGVATLTSILYVPWT